LKVPKAHHPDLPPEKIDRNSAKGDDCAITIASAIAKLDAPIIAIGVPTMASKPFPTYAVNAFVHTQDKDHCRHCCCCCCCCHCW